MVISEIISPFPGERLPLFITDEAIAVLVPIFNLQLEHSNFQKILEVIKNLVNGRRTQPDAFGYFMERKIKSVINP